MFYTNPSIDFLTKSEIVEWDLKAGNLSLIKEYNLFDKDVIHKLEDMDKKDRVIAVGNLMRENKSFSKELEKLFNKTIGVFIKENKLEDEDIISIKRDAVFVKNRSILKNTFGKYLEFRPKNLYHSYLRIPSYEFYLGESTIDVKGIEDSVLDLHKEGILQYIQDVLYLSSYYKDLHRYLKEFVLEYKKKNLLYDYYREFNTSSKYSLVIEGYQSYVVGMEEDLLEFLDISFNYKNIVLPVIQIFL